METTMIWNAILTLAVGSFVWWIRGTSQKIDRVEEQIYQVREDLAKDYVSKQDFRSGMDDFAKRFDKVEEKLDTLIMKIKV
tara:strand:+ start:5670 stop:5912 length:243 start_codon:yes stop_codon:yes gene_type:complete